MQIDIIIYAMVNKKAYDTGKPIDPWACNKKNAKTNGYHLIFFLLAFVTA